MDHNAFNQGLYDTARAHNAGQSEVLAELDAINKRQRQYEANKRTAVTPYQPSSVVECVPQEPQPYQSRAEALQDMKKAFGETVVFLAPKVIGGAGVVGAAFWVWSFFKGLAVGAVATGAAIAAPAVGVSLAPIGFGALVLAFLWFLISGLKGDCAKSGTTASGGNTANVQNIHVTVNVAGANVTTNTNGK